MFVAGSRTSEHNLLPRSLDPRSLRSNILQHVVTWSKGSFFFYYSAITLWERVLFFISSQVLLLPKVPKHCHHFVQSTINASNLDAFGRALRWEWVQFFFKKILIGFHIHGMHKSLDILFLHCWGEICSHLRKTWILSVTKVPMWSALMAFHSLVDMDVNKLPSCIRLVEARKENEVCSSHS